MKTSARTKLLAISIIGCLIVSPSLAFAGPEEASQYYEQALDAYQNDEFAEAADLLERAYAEDPNLIYQYNRVLALQAMGEYDRALKVLDIYGNPMREDGRFDDISEIRAQIEQAKAEEEAMAAADSQDNNKPDADQQDADPQYTNQQDAGLSDVDEPVDDGPNILAWSLVGAGVASIGVGSLFGAKVFMGDVADRRDALDNGTPGAEVYAGFEDPSAQYQNDQNTWDTHRTMNWVFTSVGAAALIGGGTLLAMDYFGERDTPAADDSAEVSLTPYLGADAAGGVLNISF